jgi:aminoglycoside phosphotransferase (APT) family kinase protein
MTPATAGVKLGEGREAEVYAWGADAVLKLYRPGYHGYRTEASVLSALGRPRSGAPAVRHRRDRGPDLLTLLQRQPWRVRSLARAFAAAHLTIGRCEAPAGLPVQRESLACRIDDGPLPAPLHSYVRQVLEGLPDGDRLCHGDFHPGNALVAGDRIGVIDWANATRGTPASDHARTLLLVRWANPLPGTPALSRALIAAGRSLTARLYAPAYRAGSPPSANNVHRWLVVHATARFSEGIEAETGTLVRLIEDARRRMPR